MADPLQVSSPFVKGSGAEVFTAAFYKFPRVSESNSLSEDTQAKSHTKITLEILSFVNVLGATIDLIVANGTNMITTVLCIFFSYCRRGFLRSIAFHCEIIMDKDPQSLAT
ncbi:hypothetical protein K435DRAFT_776589 [Dendrothele bispora CBS 962.96]|uniref:Uncharacterized protein n=1 Tax=Dendrothele bispora (strain CBS 962.96) TaxID=1314807 RepID=A0A4V4HGW1_DENBC|nr:hypothetical protein K435DRAFT_776589 [Dendrothele bispora CBS 962.96]